MARRCPPYSVTASASEATALRRKTVQDVSADGHGRLPPVKYAAVVQ